MTFLVATETEEKLISDAGTADLLMLRTVSRDRSRSNECCLPPCHPPQHSHCPQQYYHRLLKGVI